MAYRWVLFWAKFSVHFIKMGAFLGRNFLYISVKCVHFSGKNVCTLGHKFVPEPSITSKIHREPSPGMHKHVFVLPQLHANMRPILWL